jgi:hypothetical protein
MKAVADRMRDGITRKKLACIFGTPLRPTASALILRPHDPAFAHVVIGALASEFPSANVDVAFTDLAMPSLATVEKALGPSKVVSATGGASVQREIPLEASEKVDLHATLVMADAAKGRDRVASLMLRVVDRRGPTKATEPCHDGVRVTIHPSQNRFAPGEWTFVARDATSRAAIATVSCAVPEDVLDLGVCTPNGERPPGAIQAAMANRIVLVLPVTTAKMDLELSHDGAPVSHHELTPRIERGPAGCAPSGTWTRAHETVRLGAETSGGPERP